MVNVVLQHSAAIPADAPIGIIGAGQMGMALAQALRTAGASAITVYSQPADAQTRARVQQAGLTWSDKPQGLVHALIVCSAVPQTAAVEVARACAPALHPQAIYVDLNSLGAAQKQAVAQHVLHAQRRFVDAAVLGAAADGIRMPLICSGADAEAIVHWLVGKGMNARVVGRRIGDAAAIKIVRSVLAKGLEALYVEALLAARRLGIETEVLHTFCDWLDQRPAQASAELLVTSHLLHAERRMHEVDMSVATLRAAGIKPVMAQAARDRLAKTAASGVATRLSGHPASDWASALALLDAALSGDKASGDA